MANQHRMYMILVVGGIKGGSGKTTLATNLVVMRSNQSKKVLLVDADEQKSAYDWSTQRVSGDHPSNFTTVCLYNRSVFDQIDKMKSNYDDVIVDSGGRDTVSQRAALLCADFFLIPFRPRSYDIWTLGKIKDLIIEVSMANTKLKCVAVLNQADHTGSDNRDASEILSECEGIEFLPVILGSRKVYANAASDGLGVVEMSDQKAKKEIESLHDLIFNRC